MSSGISGGKQVIKFANTSNGGRVCLFKSSSFDKFYVITVVLAVRPSTVVCDQKVKIYDQFHLKIC